MKLSYHRFLLFLGIVPTLVSQSFGAPSDQVINCLTQDSVAQEGDSRTIGRVLITRSGAAATSVVVDFKLTGTATPFVDYDLILNPCLGCGRADVILTESRVTIAAGQLDAIVGFRAREDHLVEGTEKALFELLAPLPNSDASSYQIGDNNIATVEILDSPLIPNSVAIAEVSYCTKSLGYLLVRGVPSRVVTNWSVQESVGIGTTVQKMSDDGTFDPSTGVIRWGPFTTSLPRNLSAQIVGENIHSPIGSALFNGTPMNIIHSIRFISFDQNPGSSELTNADCRPVSGPRIAHLDRRPDGIVQLLVVDDDARNQAPGCDVEYSDDFKVWKRFIHLDCGIKWSTPLDSDAGKANRRFYRITRTAIQ